jgi:hypothetical protein
MGSPRTRLVGDKRKNLEKRARERRSEDPPAHLVQCASRKAEK